MSYFAAVLTRTGDTWHGVEVRLDGCESIGDIADVSREFDGDVRLVFIEEDDEYAAIVRVDADEDEPRAFLSDGHAADAYPMAALIADELPEIGDEPEDDDLLDGALPVHDSAPFGEPDLVEDLGTSAVHLLGMCAHEGTLPIDVIAAVCEKAGCLDQFDSLRA